MKLVAYPILSIRLPALCWVVLLLCVSGQVRVLRAQSPSPEGDVSPPVNQQPVGTLAAFVPNAMEASPRIDNQHFNVFVESIPIEERKQLPVETRIVAQTKVAQQNFWSGQVAVRTKIALRRGQPGLLRFWGRTTTPDVTAENLGQVAVYLQRGGEPWDKSFLVKRRLPRRWKLFEVPFRVHEEFPPGNAQLCLGFGFDTQTIELAGVAVEVYDTSVDIETLPQSE